MDARVEGPFRERADRFSRWLLAVALGVGSFFSQGYSCNPATGDATLSSLEVEVLGQNEISAFDPDQGTYNVWLPLGTDTAIVRAYSTDPGSSISYNLSVYNVYAGTFDTIDYGYFPTGGGEITLAGLLPEGRGLLYITVRAPGGRQAYYRVATQVGCSDCDDGDECTINACDTSVEVCFHPAEPDDTPCDYGGEVGSCVSGVCEEGFPCTEQGILDAIAMGGGPHTFACSGPTTVVTQAEIVIDNDVILDGEGNLTVDGNYDHLVLSVPIDVAAELIGVTVSGGGELSQTAPQALGILNEGSLTLTDSTVAYNDVYWNAVSPAIYNGGVLTLQRSTISDNNAGEVCGAIESTNTLALIDSSLSYNGYEGGGYVVCNFGSMVLINSTVSENYGQGAAILATGATTLVNSTISENNYDAVISAVYQNGGTLTLISSTVTSSDSGNCTVSLSSNADLSMTNSLVVAPEFPFPDFAACCDYIEPGLGSAISGGGNIESGSDSCGLTDPTDLVNVTAAELNLGPLADYGGPTLTHALLPSSVAIDHVPAAMCVDDNGDPLTADQRGVARPQGAACDAGAFEYADCSGSVCDDGSFCTVDYCDAPDYSWCVNNPLPDGTPCSPGPACDSGDGMCSAGVCENTSGCGL